MDEKKYMPKYKRRQELKKRIARYCHNFSYCVCVRYLTEFPPIFKGSEGIIPSSSENNFVSIFYFLQFKFWSTIITQLYLHRFRLLYKRIKWKYNPKYKSRQELKTSWQGIGIRWTDMNLIQAKFFGSEDFHSNKQ